MYVRKRRARWPRWCRLRNLCGPAQRLIIVFANVISTVIRQGAMESGRNDCQAAEKRAMNATHAFNSPVPTSVRGELSKSLENRDRGSYMQSQEYVIP
jgi:hypothetical protein